MRKIFGSGIIYSLCCIMMYKDIHPFISAFLFTLGTLVNTCFIFFIPNMDKIFYKTRNTFTILLINLLTIYIFCFIYGFFDVNIRNLALANIIGRIQNGYSLILLNSICCGILMSISIKIGTEHSNYIMTMIPIIFYIMCKFENSMANIGYLGLTNTINLDFFIYQIICIIGNVVGFNFFLLFYAKPNKHFQ